MGRIIPAQLIINNLGGVALSQHRHFIGVPKITPQFYWGAVDEQSHKKKGALQASPKKASPV